MHFLFYFDTLKIRVFGILFWNIFWCIFAHPCTCTHSQGVLVLIFTAHSTHLFTQPLTSRIPKPEEILTDPYSTPLHAQTYTHSPTHTGETVLIFYLCPLPALQVVLTVESIWLTVNCMKLMFQAIIHLWDYVHKHTHACKHTHTVEEIRIFKDEKKSMCVQCMLSGLNTCCFQCICVFL